MQRLFLTHNLVATPSLARRSRTLARTVVTITKCGKKNNIFRLSMNSAPVNSLDLTLIKDIKTALVEAENSPECKGIILSSSCRVFCAGLDLKELYQSTPEKLFNFWQHFQDTLFSVYSCKKTVVAEMAGVAPAGGCMLAMACDIRVSSEKCQIGLNEAAFGLVAPYFGAEMMEDVIGKRLAYRACAVGTLFPAAEAKSIGLIDEVILSSNVDPDAPSLEATAESQCELWMRAPGRQETKMMMRRDRISQWRKGQEVESQEFTHRVLDGTTQNMIGAYLASLSSGSANKKK